MNALIEARADVNADCGHALFFACLATVVAALLAAGARADFDHYKCSFVTAAIQSNLIESLKLLLAAGADMRGTRKDSGVTSLSALSLATLVDISVVKVLVNSIEGTVLNRVFCVLYRWGMRR